MTINIVVIDEAGERALLSGCNASWRAAKKRACQWQKSGRERKPKLKVSGSALYSRDFFHVPPHVTADDILQIKC